MFLKHEHVHSVEESPMTIRIIYIEFIVFNLCVLFCDMSSVSRDAVLASHSKQGTCGVCHFV